MTECERLISEGKLSASFLQEETRCDWKISSKMKKLWALQIDLIKQVESICTKYGLTYYLIGGGCIGVIRHKGCIPWDDDLDIALKREDYNIFIEKAQKELKEPYFLQTPVTDPGYYRPFIKLRNNNGTSIDKGNQKLAYNNGISLDIFPLDGYDDNFECRLFWKISRIKSLIAITSYNAFSANTHTILRKILYLCSFFVFPFGIKHFFISHNKNCTKLSKKYKNKIGIQYAHFNRNCWTWDSSLFDKVEWRPFEYTEMPIPAGYHDMLTATYGNYMQFPPFEKRGNKHEFEIEPDIPYKEYCQHKYGVKYK